MMIIRATVTTSVDIQPDFAPTTETAMARVREAVRSALADLGNVREGVGVRLELTDVMVDSEVPGYYDQDDDRPFTH